MNTYRDPLNKLEHFDTDGWGYMCFLRVFPVDALTTKYVPAIWDDVYVRELHALHLARWHTFPYRFKINALTADKDFPHLSCVTGTYDAGYHIYLFSEEYEIPMLFSNPGPLVWVKVKFRKVTATGWRRGNRMVVAKEIFLEQEV